MGKKYVKIIAEFNEDGKIAPLSLIWEDGRKYKITHIIDVCRSASTKAGGTGYRYTVLIEGRERYLWFEDIIFNKTVGGKWFVEL